MVNIVFYGTFVWVLLTGYPNIMKSELLNEVDEVWGGKAGVFANSNLRKMHSTDVQRHQPQRHTILDIVNREHLQKLWLRPSGETSCTGLRDVELLAVFGWEGRPSLPRNQQPFFLVS